MKTEDERRNIVANESDSPGNAKRLNRIGEHPAGKIARTARPTCRFAQCGSPILSKKQRIVCNDINQRALRRDWPLPAAYRIRRRDYFNSNLQKQLV